MSGYCIYFDFLVNDSLALTFFLVSLKPFKMVDLVFKLIYFQALYTMLLLNHQVLDQLQMNMETANL